MEAIIELKKEKQEKQEKAKAPPPPPEKESEDSEAEEYSESEDEKYAPTIRKVQTTKPPPPPKEFKRRVKIIKPKEVKEEPESELYSKANIEILRNKLYQQTRQRLIGDLFNY